MVDEAVLFQGLRISIVVSRFSEKTILRQLGITDELSVGNFHQPATRKFLKYLTYKPVPALLEATDI